MKNLRIGARPVTYVEKRDWVILMKITFHWSIFPSHLAIFAQLCVLRQHENVDVLWSDCVYKSLGEEEGGPLYRISQFCISYRKFPFIQA